MLAHANNLTVLFIARAVEGFSIGGLGVTQAYVADCTTPQQRERAYSLLAMAHGTASIMGPAICVALLPFGNAFPFTTASIVALGTVIFTYFFLGESHTPSTVPLSLTRSIARALSHKELRRLLFIYLCFMNGFTMWISSLGMIVQRLVGFTSSQASLLYGYSAVIGVAVQALLAAHLLRFMNLRTTLFTGLLCAFFAYCGIGFMTLPAAVFVVVCLWSVGSALVRPTLKHTILRLCRRKRAGRRHGRCQCSLQLLFLYRSFNRRYSFHVPHDLHRDSSRRIDFACPGLSMEKHLDGECRIKTFACNASRSNYLIILMHCEPKHAKSTTHSLNGCSRNGIVPPIDSIEHMSSYSPLFSIPNLPASAA